MILVDIRVSKTLTIFCTFFSTLIYLQTDRIRKAAALKIQRHYRGHAIRQKHKQRLRAEFDEIQNSYKKHKIPSVHASMNIKKVLLTQLLAFFEIKKDDGRIVSKYKSKLVYIKYGYKCVHIIK